MQSFHHRVRHFDAFPNPCAWPISGISMKLFKIIPCAIVLASFATAAPGAVLDTLPSAMGQGGMVHIDVVFKNTANGTFSSSLEFGGSVVPDMKPLSDWSPGNTVNPVKPWYATIDPTQEAQWFSSRWGFRIDTDNSDLVPAGTALGIRMTSSTPNLGAYFYNTSGSGTWQPVFLTINSPHDYVLWSGAMWHPYFTMPSTTPYGSTVSATFEFFLANATNSGNVDWTTVAGYEPGYSIGTQTITWNAIPEPGTAVLFLAAASGWFIVSRRKNHLP